MWGAFLRRAVSVGEERGGWRDAGQDVHTSIQGNQGNRFRPLKSLLCLQLLNLNKIRSLLLGSTITSADQELINKCRQTKAVWKMSGFHQSLLSVFFFVICSVNLSLKIFLYVFTAHSRPLPPSIWPSLRRSVSPLRVWLACVVYVPSRCSVDLCCHLPDYLPDSLSLSGNVQSIIIN